MSLPPINNNSIRSTTSTSPTPGGEESRITHEPLPKAELSGTGGGVLRYITPQVELFSHYSSPHTQQREYSPSFVCGKVNPPEDYFVLSPRGDFKPQHRPFSKAFMSGPLKHEDTFDVIPTNKSSLTRPYSPAFQCGPVHDLRKDDIYLLSPRKEEKEKNIVSNMRCGLSPERQDAFMLEPNPVVSPHRPHSPSFICGSIKNPEKDDYFVLTPTDSSKLKDSRPPGSGMKLGGALEHKDDIYMLEPNPQVPLTRPHSEAFLCGNGKDPTDEFDLALSEKENAPLKTSGMRIGGPLAHNDQFAHDDPYRDPKPLTSRPSGNLKPGSKNKGNLSDGAGVFAQEPYVPAVDEGRKGGLFSAGVATEDNAINNYTPNDYPLPESRRPSVHDNRRMNAGHIERVGDFVYVSEPEQSIDIKNRSDAAPRMNMGGMSRNSDQFMLFDAEPQRIYDRKTPYLSRKTHKNRDDINWKPPVTKAGMKIPVSNKYNDGFVNSEGGPVIDEARHGSSMRTNGKLHTDSTMEKYVGLGTDPIPTAKNQKSGMRIGTDIKHNEDAFVIKEGGNVIDNGRHGSSMRTSGKLHSDSTMEKYVGHGPEPVPCSKGTSHGMLVGQVSKHTDDIFNLSPCDTKIVYSKNTSGMRAGAKVNVQDLMGKYMNSSSNEKSICGESSTQIAFKVPTTCRYNDTYALKEGGPVLDKGRHGSSMKTHGKLHTESTMEKYIGLGTDPTPKAKHERRGMKMGTNLPRNNDKFSLNWTEQADMSLPPSSLLTGGKPVTTDTMEKYESHGADSVPQEKNMAKGMKVGRSVNRKDEFVLSPNLPKEKSCRVDKEGEKKEGVEVSKPSLVEEGASYESPYRQMSDMKQRKNLNDLYQSEHVKTYGRAKREDKYGITYQEPVKEATEIRPHSESFLAGTYPREQDAVFTEPARKIPTRPDSAKAFKTTAVDQQHVPGLGYDEIAAKLRCKDMRPYSTPYSIDLHTNHHDIYLLEPNKNTKNLTRPSTHAFSCGNVSHDEDYFIFQYQPPLKCIEEESSFCVRHVQDHNEKFVYDLEYYVTPPVEPKKFTDEFITYGHLNYDDMYCNHYDPPPTEATEIRPHSISFMAGNFDRESDAFFTEPAQKIDHVARPTSGDFFNTYDNAHKNDMFVLKYDEEAERMKSQSTRPYSSPYIVSSTLKHEDKFLLEPNKVSLNVTRSLSSDGGDKGVFVAGSRRIKHDDSVLLEPFQEKPSMERPRSSPFVSQVVIPRNDIFFNEPIAKPDPRPTTGDVPRHTWKKEEKIAALLSSVIEPTNSDKNNVSSGQGAINNEKREIETSNKKNVKPQSDQGMISSNYNSAPGNTANGPETEQSETQERVPSLEEIKKLLKEQRSKWSCKTTPDFSDDKPAPKPMKQRKRITKVNITSKKSLELQRQRIADAKLKAMLREEKKNEIRANKVSDLLGKVLEKGSKKPNNSSPS